MFRGGGGGAQKFSKLNMAGLEENREAGKAGSLCCGAGMAGHGVGFEVAFGGDSARAKVEWWQPAETALPLLQSKWHPYEGILLCRAAKRAVMGRK